MTAEGRKRKAEVGATWRCQIGCSVLLFLTITLSPYFLSLLLPIFNVLKGKFQPTTGHESPEREYRYSSTPSLTSALDEMGGQRHFQATLPPGKIQYPLYRRLDGSQGRSGRLRNISPSPGFDSRTVQSVPSRYTVYAVQKMEYIH